MNVAPAATYEATFAAGAAALVGTIRLGVLDNQGAVVEALSTAGIIETPAGSGVYAATRTSPNTEGQYTLIWSLDGSTAPDQVSIDELTVTGNAPFGPGPPLGTAAYATVAELARVLELRSPSTPQTDAMQRCLDAATFEVDSYVGHTDQYLSPFPPLAVEVTLERAVEHWSQSFTPYGVFQASGQPILTARDTFIRHGHKLLPLKETFGLA